MESQTTVLDLKFEFTDFDTPFGNCRCWDSGHHIAKCQMVGMCTYARHPNGLTHLVQLRHDRSTTSWSLVATNTVTTVHPVANFTVTHAPSHFTCTLQYKYSTLLIHLPNSLQLITEHVLLQP